LATQVNTEINTEKGRKSMESYFVVEWGEDGVSFYKATKSEIIERIQEDIENEFEQEYQTELPDDLEYGKGTIIIKGEIVIPKEKKVVSEWDIE
jgi:hypothetical protein